MKNLFVGNLSTEMLESDLRALFTPFGQVTRARVITDRETGRVRGFAFVEMPNDEEASRAIAALNGKTVAGRTVKVNEARPKADRAPAGDRRPHSGAPNRARFSTEDYREVARKPQEPRW